MIEKKEYKIVFLHKSNGFFAQIWDGDIVEQYDTEPTFLKAVEKRFNQFIRKVLKF